MVVVLNYTNCNTFFKNIPIVKEKKLKFEHKPVLLEECIQGLNINPDGIYVDGTIGGAGHSLEIAKRLSKKGMLIGIDKDEEALIVSKNRLSNYSNVKYVHGNHDEINEILGKMEISEVDRDTIGSWGFFVPN